LKKKVAIIGAGPSGLAVLYAFQSLKVNGNDIPEIVCFEKQDNWGGLWNYTWRTGLDQYGEAVHGSMYKYLWSNGPKECLEFTDYSFEEHFGKQIASFPPRTVLFDYIEGRYKKTGVRDKIKFSTVVKRVEKYKKGFIVTTFQLTSSTTRNEYFDNVVVCSGHFSTPNMPNFEGFSQFPGRILHAHDFRNALEFKGQDILIIGTSYSAEDIGSQCWKYGAKSITVSHRTAAMGYDWPVNWKEVPLLNGVDGKTARFKDGSSKAVDTIILCTGYLHNFPFMNDNLKLVTENRLAPSDLYKGIVFTRAPNLHYIGMQDQWFTFSMFDAQAWWSRDVILGKITLPSYEDMLRDVKMRMASEDSGEDYSHAIRFQGDYVKELISETNYPSIDIEGACKIFNKWQRHKKENIMTFRDKTYKSIITGSIAPTHHTQWKYAMEDSIESYLLNTAI